MNRSKKIYTILLTLLVLICIGVPAAYALPTTHYAASSRMATGKWVKISIKTEGMQFVSNTQLKAWGFENPQKVNVYGYGGRRIREAMDNRHPDDLPLQPCVRTSQGIVFYGVGTTSWQQAKDAVMSYSRVVNNYSAESYYFLSDAPVETEEMYSTGHPATPDEKTIRRFTERLLHEKDEYAPANTGAVLLGEDFRSNSRQNFSFPLPGIMGDSVSVAIVFGAKTSGGKSRLTYTANGKDLPQDNADVIDGVSGSVSDVHMVNTTSRKKVKGITNGKLDLQIRYSYDGVLYLARLDNITVNYQRALDLSGASLAFALDLAAGDVTVSVSGCSPQTLIWDVTDPATPMRVDFALNGNTATFAPGAKGLREYIAFEPEKVSTAPAMAETVKNQNLHALENPQMVIITLSAFREQAERIAQMHRDNENMVVHVVTDREVFNEFSSGTPDIGAFRKFCKMFYDRTVGQEDSFAYCLLMGRPTYDNRALTPLIKNSYDRLLIWQSESSNTESSSYSTDNIIGMLADSNDASFNISSAKMDIAVGRMPVKNVPEARQMVDKLLTYVNRPNYGAWRNRVVILADDGDNGVHLDQAQRCYNAMQQSDNGGAFLYERLYLDAYQLEQTPQGDAYPTAKARLQQLFDQGMGVLDYIGHANPMSWTHEKLWTFTDISNMTNKNWPFVYHASCEFIRWDSDDISGAETMWLYPEAGVIGFIAANRKVYISQNGTLNQGMSANLFNRDKTGQGLRVGDIYRQGMNAYPGADSNKLRYCLMGDPAMRFFNPAYNVVVEKINGVDINSIQDASDYPIVRALGEVTFSGCITDAEGQPTPDFNGVLIPEIYDAEETIETFGNGDEGAARIYNDRKNRLYVGKTEIKDGRWEMKINMPSQIANNFTPPLISCYAYSEDGREANGGTDRFYIYGWSEETDDDTEGPEITLLAFNNEGWTSGGVVGSNAYLLARFSDPSGINISSLGIGHRMTAIVDGKKVYDDLTDYYEPSMDNSNEGYLKYPITGLPEGDHTLKFVVWDNVGNSSSKEIAFKVATAGVQSDLEIHTNANPASVSATIYVYSTASTEAVTTIEVYDMAGRRVWDYTINGGNGQATWSLTDGTGSRVPRGIYLYRVTVEDRDGTIKRKTQKLAVTAP